MSVLRVIFLGTSGLACCLFEALMRASDIEMLGVISQPDRAKGRKLKLTPTPIKAAALHFSLPIWQPSQLKKDMGLIGHLGKLSPDLIVVADYGQLLPPSLLKIPKFGCVNVHPSLLPKYRGAAPIPWAIINGDSETGISLMKMDSKWDTGCIIAQQKTPIGIDENAGELHNRLALMGASLLLKTLPSFVRGELKIHPQNEDEASQARKLIKSDGWINWSRSAFKIHNQIRGLHPFLGTWSELICGKKQTRIKLSHASFLDDFDCEKKPGSIISASPKGLKIGCGKGVIEVHQVQREGGKCMNVGAFLSGFPISQNAFFVNSPSDPNLMNR